MSLFQNSLRCSVTCVTRGKVWSDGMYVTCDGIAAQARTPACLHIRHLDTSRHTVTSVYVSKRCTIRTHEASQLRTQFGFLDHDKDYSLQMKGTAPGLRLLGLVVFCRSIHRFKKSVSDESTTCSRRVRCRVMSARSWCSTLCQ